MILQEAPGLTRAAQHVTFTYGLQRLAPDEFLRRLQQRILSRPHSATGQQVGLRGPHDPAQANEFIEQVARHFQRTAAAITGVQQHRQYLRIRQGLGAPLQQLVTGSLPRYPSGHTHSAPP